MSEGMTISVDLSGIDLAGIGVRAASRVPPIVHHFGQLLVTTAQRNASLPRTAPRGPGTGGPRLITGDLVRSINAVYDSQGVTVGTNRPQARRLERGFVGPDALGRRVHQPPYPFLGPALDEIGPQFRAAIAALAVEAARG